MSKDNQTYDPLVELSVSGTSFTVRRQLLTEHEWMLSKIVDNDIPWALHHNGRYFIDQDPGAFRWVLHYTRFQSLPTGILGSVNELEVIRSLADFLCFQALVQYVDESIAKCMDVRSRVEELEKENADTKTAHADEIEDLQKVHAREIATLEAAHKKQLDPLQRLKSKLDGMDGITFTCSKSSSNHWTSRQSLPEKHRVVVLWPATALNIERSKITCPCCKQGAGALEHQNKEALFGNRGVATTTSSIVTVDETKEHDGMKVHGTMNGRGRRY